jgi:hypothetical protein
VINRGSTCPLTGGKKPRRRGFAPLRSATSLLRKTGHVRSRPTRLFDPLWLDAQSGSHIGHILTGLSLVRLTCLVGSRGLEPRSLG